MSDATLGATSATFTGMSYDEIVSLFAAILGNTVALLSGILGIALTVWGVIFPQTPFRSAFIIAGVVAVIVSPALAWIDEHRGKRKLEATIERLQQRRAEFSLEIANIILGEWRERSAFIALVVTVINKGQETSIAKGWSISVRLPDGTEERAQIAYSQEPLIFGFTRKDVPPMQYRREDQLAIKTLEHPILARGAASGLLMGIFELPRDILNHAETKVVVQCEDADNNRYSAEVVMGDSGAGAIQVVPTSGVRILPYEENK